MANVAYQYTDIDVEVTKFAPDDTGQLWKHPYLWQKDFFSIHQLVLEETGMDIIHPRGFEILIKLWTPSNETDCGLVLSDHDVRSKMQMSTVGKILRMGSEAFSDLRRFPLGPRVTYGEWAIFRGTERQKIELSNGIMLALVNDDRFMAVTADPDEVRTGFNIEQDWRDH